MVKVWKDKKGNWIDFKEFKERLTDGISNISPLQLVVQQLKGMNIILLGILCGIVVCCFNIKNLWWLLTILIGSLYVNVTQYIGTWQKKKALENIENQFSDFDKGLEVIGMTNEDTPFESKEDYVDLTKEVKKQ